MSCLFRDPGYPYSSLRDEPRDEDFRDDEPALEAMQIQAQRASNVAWRKQLESEAR